MRNHSLHLEHKLIYFNEPVPRTFDMEQEDQNNNLKMAEDSRDYLLNHLLERKRITPDQGKAYKEMNPYRAAEELKAIKATDSIVKDLLKRERITPEQAEKYKNMNPIAALKEVRAINEVDSLIRELLENKDISEEEAEEYRKRSPITAFEELRAINSVKSLINILEKKGISGQDLSKYKEEAPLVAQEKLRTINHGLELIESLLKEKNITSEQAENIRQLLVSDPIGTVQRIRLYKMYLENKDLENDKDEKRKLTAEKFLEENLKAA